MSGSKEKRAEISKEERIRRELERRAQSIPVHIHLHQECSKDYSGKEDEEPCININVNISQCNYQPQFHVCFGDTLAFSNGTGDHNPPGSSSDDPPP